MNPNPALPEPKWFASLNDIRISSPGQHVLPQVLKQQAGLPESVLLIRDHNSPNDPAMPDGQLIDLAAGNVFYSLEPCGRPSGLCSGEPKRAISVDDRVEEIGQPQQTEQSIRQLFDLPDGVQLVRDLEGTPDDQALVDGETVWFKDGPVFLSRHCKVLQITVNSRKFTSSQGVNHQMTGAQIARLVVANSEGHDVFRLDGENRRTPIELTDTVAICSGQEFLVVRCQVAGGFQPARIDRELGILRESGARVTLVEGPVPAVVFHDLPLRTGAPVPFTDVLVPIPHGYPANFIDWAYLPEGSPLFNKVPGVVRPNGDPNIQALTRTWIQVSYHPHTNGGGPAWDKELHGFHTYLGELISWLHKA